MPNCVGRVFVSALQPYREVLGIDLTRLDADQAAGCTEI